jgi:hypothetical protein
MGCQLVRVDCVRVDCTCDGFPVGPHWMVGVGVAG